MEITDRLMLISSLSGNHDRFGRLATSVLYGSATAVVESADRVGE
jgi:hypothetical protein